MQEACGSVVVNPGGLKNNTSGDIFEAEVRNQIIERIRVDRRLLVAKIED